MDRRGFLKSAAGMVPAAAAAVGFIASRDGSKAVASRGDVGSRIAGKATMVIGGMVTLECTDVRIFDAVASSAGPAGVERDITKIGPGECTLIRRLEPPPGGA